MPPLDDAAEVDASSGESADEDERSPSLSPPQPTHSGELVVVGIGASAGGLNALGDLISQLPTHPGMALVVVQHLDPTHSSALTEILAKQTSLPVTEIAAETPVEVDHIYVIPPNRELLIEDSVLHLSRSSAVKGTRAGIDRFFRSLAHDRGEYAVGIILSGTGTDGTAGLKEIKDRGGLSIVQDPNDAGHDGMPRSAIESLQVDFVLPAAQIPRTLAEYVRHATRHGPWRTPSGDPPEPRDLQPILEMLREKTEPDFSEYRQNTLHRRIQRRMGLRQISELAIYRRYLDDRPEELEALRSDLLIGVTQFFRDPVAWQTLRDDVLVPLVASASQDQPIRAWCPGCATGEEAYTLSMLLHEQVSQQEKHCPIQIFGSDIAPRALEVARKGVYPKSISSDLTDARLRQFLVQQSDDSYRVNKSLRESVVFAQQNVLAHPPFSKLDLICCRNLLIYLENEAQRRILSVFDFALNPSGYLFLGSSESLKSHEEAFQAVSSKWRIFRRLPRGPVHLLSAHHAPEPKPRSREERSTFGAAENPLDVQVVQQLLSESESGIAVISRQGRVLYLQGRVDQYLQLSLGQTRPDRPYLTDLAREGLHSKLRTLIFRCTETQQRATAICGVHRDGDIHSCRLTVRPLAGSDADAERQLVTFDPIGFDPIGTLDGKEKAVSQRPPRQAGASPPDAASSAADSVSRDEYRALQHELSTTQEQLNSSIEDLATANEELRASHEEATSVNEELQSSNEELETSKEELQSLNEELTTLNNQLEVKLTELQRTTDDLDNLLTSSSVPTLFLDRDLRIRLFTPSCRQLFRLIATDEGRPLSDIRKRFEDDALLRDTSEVLRDLHPRQTQVTGEAGHSYLREIRPYRTEDHRIQGVVITFADVTGMQALTDQLRYRELQQKALAHLGHRALIESDLQTLLDVATESLLDTMQIDLASVWNLLADREELVLKAGAGWDPELIGHATIPGTGRSQAGYTLQRKQPVLVANLATETRFDASSLLLEQGVTSGLSVLILAADGQPYGVLSVHARRQVEFIADDTHFVQSVANVLAEAINRQQIEQKRIRQRDEIDTIYRTASIGLCVLDRDLRFMRINERLAEINGIPAEQHLGKTVRELLPNLADTLEPKLRQIFVTGEPIYDLEIRGETPAAPGEDRIWIQDWTPLTNPQGEVIAVNIVAVEVTQHRLAEQHLRESENRLRLAARAARFGFYDSDLTSGLVYWSPEMRKLVDFPADEPVHIRPGDLPDFIHPDDRERVRRELAASLDPQGKGEFESEHRIVRRDGEERWILMRGITLFEPQGEQRIPVRTIGVVVDIHHRRLAEAGLRESEHRFRALVEATAQVVWTTDAEGMVVEDSPSWRQFTGQTLEQWRGAGWLNAVHPEDRQSTRAAWQLAIREDAPYEIDYRLRHFSGEYRWTTARAAPIRDSHRSIRGWVGMNSDITEQKEFEKALQDARKRAEVANQSKSDFLANMSHEIRTPMTAILGYADLLAERIRDADDLQSIETIRRNGRFLLEIVNDILDLSKIEADKMEVAATEVSPEAVIGEVVSLMNVRAEEKEIPLKLETLGPLPESIQCDGVRLRQILLNLVGNAIKFTEDGEVRLVAQLLPDQEQIRFDIIDTGIGIAEEQQRRLFQPFNQADNSITRSHGGTGLGLAISQRLANLLGGYLQVHSVPGRGSTFSVTVATGSLKDVTLIQPQLGNPAAATEQDSPPPVKLDGCILIVDDRRDIRILARHFLQDAGATVEMCENGQEAIEMLTENPDPPTIDAVIMDISMPVMDGYTAASRLRQAGVKLPIIALTANAMEGDRDKCLNAGFTDYTTKPLNKKRLVEMVASYIAGRDGS